MSIPDSASASPAVHDATVDTARGRLAVRCWQPHAEPGRVPVMEGAVVLLHDSLGSIDLWKEFPSQLAQGLGRPVVAYDRLGYGRSDACTGLPAADFVSSEASDGLLPVLQRLGIGRCVLLGHSVGGGMAVNAAAQMPERVQAVVTIAAQAFPEDRTLEAIAQARVQFQDPAQLDRLARYHGDKARWVVDAWTETWLSPAFAHWHLRDVLPQVRCPMLVLHGEHDEYGTAVHPRTLQQGGAGPSHMVLLPDTYHLPHRERPEMVVALVQDFLYAYDTGETG